MVQSARFSVFPLKKEALMKSRLSIMNLEFGLSIAPSFTAGLDVCEDAKGVLTSLSSAA
jgi:hypothetical protein